MKRDHQELIDLFAELVRLTTLDEGGPASFRVRAYENALREIEEYRGDLSELSEKELVKIEGIGKSTAQKIREYFSKGHIDKLDKLRAKYPPEFVELTRIPGLGPKSVLHLRDALGIHNIDQLRVALEAKKIRELPGFGAKSEDNIAKALERMSGLGKNKRRTLAEALPLATSLVERLQAMKEVSRATYCGSLRRFRETIGDIDIVAVSSDHEVVMEAFTSFEEVEEVVGRGDTKSSVIVEGGLQVDLRVVQADQYGAAILYFTGSKAHNIKLRQRAIARSWTLNEYGLTEADGGRVVASVTEEDIYAALELDFIPPPMREDHGEVEAAAGGRLPTPIVSGELRGDWLVDATNAKEAVHEARERGLDYVVVGAPVAELAAARRQWKGRLRGVHVYWAAMLEPGASAADHEGDFAVVTVPEGASGELTEALLTSLADRSVRALVGASGRVLGANEGASFDIDRIASAVAEAGCLWIVRCGLTALDPSAELLRRVVDRGIDFALGSGASTHPLAALEYGPSHAQRGWMDAEQLANRWARAGLDAWLAKGRR